MNSQPCSKRPRKQAALTPEVKAAMLVARWAQQVGLPVGNLWEPAVARKVLREWRRLGANTAAWATVEANYTRQLGIQGNGQGNGV